MLSLTPRIWSILVSARRAERIEIIKDFFEGNNIRVSARRAERIEINVTFAVQPSAVSQPAGLRGLKFPVYC